MTRVPSALSSTRNVQQYKSRRVFIIHLGGCGSALHLSQTMRR